MCMERMVIDVNLRDIILGELQIYRGWRFVVFFTSMHSKKSHFIANKKTYAFNFNSLFTLNFLY